MVFAIYQHKLAIDIQVLIDLTPFLATILSFSACLLLNFVFLSKLLGFILRYS